MTIERDKYRAIYNNVREIVNKRYTFATGQIISWSDKDKFAIVQEDLTGHKIHARMLSPYLGNESGITSSPIEKARCLLALLTEKNDNFEDAIILGYLQDKNNKITKESDGNKDPNYTFIGHPSGMSLHIFKKNADGKKVMYGKAFDFIKFEATEKFDVVSNNVSLGQAGLTGDDPKLVNKKHLDIYNALVDSLQSTFNDLINQPMLGDLGIPLPIAIRNPASLTAFTTLVGKILAYQIKENPASLNTTSKTRAV